MERGWLSSNNIVLHGDTPEDGAIVIDTGYASHAPQTLALIASALQPGEGIRLLANTHLHSDHCGGNAAVSARYGCPIWIPPGEFDAASIWDETRLSYRATGQQCARFEPTGKLLPGDVLRQGGNEWHIHAAPGHDPHSVILFEPQSRTLLSADALWERGFGIVFPELDGEAAFEDLAATLDLIDSLEPLLVVPGHGSPFNDVRGSLGIARQRLDYFRSEPARHAAHAAKALTVFHVLEIRETSQDELIAWLLQRPVLLGIWRGFFTSIDPGDWAEQLIAELVAARVLDASGPLGTLRATAS